jgi:hypothetical protein
MPLPWAGRQTRLLCLAVLLAGCTAPQPAVQAGSCSVAQGAPMLVFELFFGRSIRGHGEVSDRAWNDFQKQVVTPNLPNGYTVFDAAGAWRNPATGQTVHERTKMLLAALPDAATSAAAVERIRTIYAEQFHQTLVGMTVAPACGAF